MILELAAIAGGIYLLSKLSGTEEPQAETVIPVEDSDSYSANLYNPSDAMSNTDPERVVEAEPVPESFTDYVPQNPVVNPLPEPETMVISEIMYPGALSPVSLEQMQRDIAERVHGMIGSGMTEEQINAAIAQIYGEAIVV